MSQKKNDTSSAQSDNKSQKKSNAVLENKKKELARRTKVRDDLLEGAYGPKEEERIRNKYDPQIKKLQEDIDKIEKGGK
jgi:hypothetical protein